MIILIRLLIFTLITIFASYAQQSKTGVHKLQSIYYQNQNTPILEKVTIFNGIDVLLEKKLHFIQSRKIALVTNHSGIDRNGTPNYIRLMEIKNVELKVIFSPEHGLFGEAADGEIINYNEIKDIPKVISLYGGTKKPTAEMLSGINLIIYDIQDIGVRFYTYISSLGLVMEAAAELNIPVLVLDRPNPIRADIIEGPTLDLKYRSFIGSYPIPIRYGNTIAELAEKIVENGWVNPVPQLETIKMEGWHPNLWFDQTELIWIPPSPNIPDLETAIIYPGMCLIEGTNISEGRGTPKPFKWIGAPWINGKKLSQALNNFHLPGVVFVPKQFTPVTIPGKAEKPKFENKQCYGIELWVTDRNTYKSIDTGVLTLLSIYNMYPEKIIIEEDQLNKRWGDNKLYEKLTRGATTEELLDY